MSKVKQEKRYFPSVEDMEAFRFCVSHNLIKLSPFRVADTSFYYLVRNNYPKDDLYFPLNNKKPPTPSNRLKLTEYEVYEKMFKIYKDFYMRNRPKEHGTLIDSVLSKEVKKEEPKKNQIKKQVVKSGVVSKPVNKNKELDLFDLIRMVEVECLK